MTKRLAFLALLATTACPPKFVDLPKPTQQQYFVLEKDHVRIEKEGNRHPCQKSPSMKTTTRAPTKTMSGRPAIDITCVLYRSPRV